MNIPEVTIIDYGVGNLLSVKRGFEHFGAKVILSSDSEVILKSERVVLPGVGAFPIAMAELEKLNLIAPIQEFGLSKKPLLAICLGMQLLMEESDEFGITTGLGLIPGNVVVVPDTTIEGNYQKVPHIGWSSLQPSVENNGWGNTVLEDNKPGEAAYFVHSFMAQPSEKEHKVAHVNYGGHRITAVIARDKLTGCQFHPEKSGGVGLKILRRFLAQ